jgi:uncharacterized protein (TIGR03435 family)
MRAGAALFVVALCRAQSFDVASVKPDAECDSRRTIRPGKLDLGCLTLRRLIGIAYGAIDGDHLRSRFLPVLGGPGWLDTDRFDVIAKAGPESSTARMAGPMLRDLLEERFQVKAHVEARQLPVYALTAASTVKLKPADPSKCVTMDLSKPDTLAAGGIYYCGMAREGRTESGALTIDVFGATMAEFAGRTLAGVVDRPVIDRTGLAGRYDIHLEYARDRSLDAEAPDGSTGPTIFTALQQQLGLKLRADKGPVEVVVVDAARRPDGN